MHLVIGCKWLHRHPITWRPLFDVNKFNMESFESDVIYVSFFFNVVSCKCKNERMSIAAAE